MGEPRKPLRAGIIGLSWIAADPPGAASDEVLGTAPPYSHASAMAAVGDIDVVAICDIDPGRASAFREQWAPHWQDIEAFTDVDELLERDLDLVSVVTPDHLHAEMVERCVSAGVPMVFTEKPFTTDLAQADHLLSLIDERGTYVAVNHTWRWRPEIVESRRLVSSETLGQLSQITIEAGGPRAMLFRNLSHFIDLALHLTPAPSVWVQGELENAPDYGLTYTGDGGRDPETDPGAWLLIGFEDGLRAYVSGFKSSPADVSIQVQCTGGRISIDQLGARIVENPRNQDGTPATVGGPHIRPLRPTFTRSGMEAGLADLIASHASGVEPSGSAHSARETVAVIDALLRANATGQRAEVARRA